MEEGVEYFRVPLRIIKVPSRQFAHEREKLSVQ